jgi:hypothetical protein
MTIVEQGYGSDLAARIRDGSLTTGGRLSIVQVVKILVWHLL